MGFDPHASPVWALTLCQRIVAVGIGLSSIEYVVRGRTLGDDGLMSWMVCRLRHPVFSRGRVARLLDVVYRYPNIVFAHGLRVALAASLLVAPIGTTADAVLLTVTTLLSILLLARQPYGSDGADQVSNIVLLSLTVGTLCNTRLALAAVAWFLAGQCCLAYLTAGVAKASNPAWRSGEALVGIFGTHMYGNPPLGRFLGDRPRLARAMGMTVVWGECLLPLMLVAPRGWLPAFLAAGFAFHLSAAFTMGLNSFLWAFPATYPAIAWAVLVSRPW